MSTVAATHVNINLNSVNSVPYVEKDNDIDYYDIGYSEKVTIDNNNYVYTFVYENGNKVINITNETTGGVEKITYNQNDSTIYLNDIEIGSIEPNSSEEQWVHPMNIWTTISNKSYYVSWGKGVSTAVVAGAISLYLGRLGPTGVLLAMGSGTVGIIAAASIGGTVKVEIQEYFSGFGAPQYRYIWSFIASTGDKYGEYIYHSATPYGIGVENEE